MVVLFWILFLVIAAHYVLLPALTVLAARFYPRPTLTGESQPSVSLIISALDEERVIAAKIENALATAYPKDRLEIMVVSDGSTDGTAGIVRQFGAVRSLHEPARRGKTHAMCRAVAESRGDILIFSDANCHYRPDAVAALVRHFADEKVGAVTGRKRIREAAERESSRGDAVYWDFESRYKTAQSRLGSVSTADGEILALRRELFPPLSADIINDDMAITFAIVGRGQRVLYEPGAISEEAASLTLGDDFRVKARMVAGGYQMLAHPSFRRLPLGFRCQVLAHKGLRYAMPLLLLALYGLSAGLAGMFYRAFFWLQTAFYALALAGKITGRRGGLLYFPLYYCTMNAAALVGLGHFLRGRGVTAIWHRAER